MRLFAAIELPESTRIAITSLAGQLRESRVAASWTKPANLHLTLRFYGEVNEGQVDLLRSSLTDSFQGITAPTLLARGSGAFPSLRRPTILWAGIDLLTGEWTPLVKACEQGARVLGLPEESRSFTPHITLARVRAHGPSPCISAVGALLEKNRATEFGQEFTPPVVVLFKSTLTHNGPIYSVLQEYPLS